MDIINLFFNTYYSKYKKVIIKILGKSYKIEELNNLKRLIYTFISLFKSSNYDLSYFKKILFKIKFNPRYYQYKNILLLIINIYLLYEHNLQEENSIDFNDMINKSLKSIKEKGLKYTWKYIIIDEYQDTSLTKFNLINEIINITSAKLLVVGDDFQSIYRFTGCNLNIFLNFNKYYLDSKIFYIKNTYRNSQELIDIAGSFIMKNKYQIKKRLISSKHLTKPIKIVLTNNYISTLKKLINRINNDNLMVIGRNNKDINNYIDKEYLIKDDLYYINNHSFRYLTIHKSKGLESDNVIIINNEDNILGFPSKLKDEPLLKYVNNNHDIYKYEEERRLFYVALTRTKNNVYLIAPYKGMSIFIKELMKYNIEIISD